MFEGILFYNIFFHLYRLTYQLFESCIINTRGIEIEQFCPMCRIANQTMLQHFSISGEEIVCVQCAQEFSFNQYTVCRSESTDFIFQSVEVDSCFTPH